MANGMQAGSYELRDHLRKLNEIDTEQDDIKSKRVLANDLAKIAAQNAGSLDVQKTANEGGANVATINNTGAMDRTNADITGRKDMLKTTIDAEAPERAARTSLYGQQGAVAEQNAIALKDEHPFRADMYKEKLVGARAQNESATLTNSLAKKYGEQRIQAEIKAQEMGVQRMGNEMDLNNMQFDRTMNDYAMSRAQGYYNHPDNVSHRVMEDWAAENDAKAQMEPNYLTSSRGQLNEYSKSILGEPGLGYSIAEKVPFVGALARVFRAKEAAATARKKASGVATPS